MKAVITTIGNEILIGQILDTNSQWMAENLRKIGVEVVQMQSIQDSREAIINSFKSNAAIADIVFYTGGLGPTNDDITKTLICEYFDCQLIRDANVLKHIEHLTRHRKGFMNERNREQADVPSKATVLHNRKGTAPGLWLEKDNTIFVFVPGVPFEMECICQDEVFPRIQNNSDKIYFDKTVLVHGIPESALAEVIEDWENNLPENLSLAYLPSSGLIRLRLSAYGNKEKSIKEQVVKELEKLQVIIPKYLVGTKEEKLELELSHLLIDNNLKLATAESCTGGYVSHLITQNAGSSAYFNGAIVSYANEVKTDVLGVNQEDLTAYGAVSEQVVTQMALGALKVLKSDYAISVSGIAGPDGGTKEKPVGTIWTAIASKNGVVTKMYKFSSDRMRNIQRTSVSVLHHLIKVIKNDYPLH